MRQNTAPQHHWETQPSQRAYRLFERPKPQNLPGSFPELFSGSFGRHCRHFTAIFESKWKQFVFTI
jgi:hypothetical protein